MSNDQDAPLMAGEEPDSEVHHDELESIDDEQSKDTVDRPSLFVWLLTVAAGISGLLFGCS
jgi:SP family myo-inositol transporter-like MFS transporter 13